MWVPLDHCQMTCNIALLTQHCEKYLSFSCSSDLILKTSSGLFFEPYASFSTSLWKAGEESLTQKYKRICQISTKAHSRTGPFSILTDIFLISIQDLHVFCCFFCIMVSSWSDDSLWFPDLLWRHCWLSHINPCCMMLVFFRQDMVNLNHNAGRI